MHDQIAERTARDAPVQPPFEQGRRLVRGQREEGLYAVEFEASLRMPPAPQVRTRQDTEVEVDEGAAAVDARIGIEGLQMLRYRLKRGADTHIEGRNAEMKVEQGVLGVTNEPSASVAFQDACVAKALYRKYEIPGGRKFDSQLEGGCFARNGARLDRLDN